MIWSDVVSAIPVMILASRFGVSATFHVCYLGNSHLFPTIFAGTVFGICNFFAKTVTIMSPMLAEVKAPIPMSCFIIACGLAGLASFFLITEQSKWSKGLKSK